jgi:hypothetical protein
MSICHVELTGVVRRNDANVTAADSQLAANHAETLTLSSTQARTTITGTLGEIWVVSVNADTMIKIATGSPSALAAGGDLMRFLPSGTTREFNVSVTGEKLSAILQA